MAASVLSFFLHSPALSLSLSLFLSISLFRIPVVVPSCVMLRSSLLYTPFSSHESLSRRSLASSRDSILSHPRVLRVYESLSPSSSSAPLPPADELRGNEREQREGRSNRPSTETAFLSRAHSPFVAHPCPPLCRPSCRPPLRSPGKLYNAKCRPPHRTFRPALCLSLSLSPILSSSRLCAVTLFLSPPLFFSFHRSLAPSCLPHCSSRSGFPRAVHSNSSLRKRFIDRDRHSRLFFLRAFSRLLELSSRV